MDLQGFEKARVLVDELRQLREYHDQIIKYGLTVNLPGSLYNNGEAKQAAINGVLGYIKKRYEAIKNELWVYHSIMSHKPEDQLGYQPTIDSLVGEDPVIEPGSLVMTDAEDKVILVVPPAPPIELEEEPSQTIGEALEIAHHHQNRPKTGYGGPDLPTADEPEIF